MQRMKNIKIWIGFVYLILLTTFLYFLFSKFSIKEITTYNFIKSNSEYLVSLRESNLFLVSITFVIFGVFWISVLLGFGSILVLASGFIFGTLIGTFIALITLTLGSSLAYIIANFFFQDLVKEKFANRFKFLEEKIKTNEFFVIFIVRIIGGTPIQLQNIIPVLFNIKLKNFFFGSLLGFAPQVYIFSALGSGLEKQIEKNIETPSFLQMITSFEIYAPILGFFILLLLAFFLRKVFYKN
tara:strand:+ start:1023 stop:1745 length:723 start_codon:yes stop_codon:yes gene_type:complete